MHFIVTTPVLNGERYIDETILSVVTQAGPFTIRYHVQDGGSGDQTLAKLAAWKRRLESGFPTLCEGIKFSFSSEPDKGLYDAVNRGFAVCGEGDVMNWINADDRIEQGAFASVAQILTAYPDISWLCGKGAIIEEDSALMQPISAVYFPRPAIAAGIFDGRFAPKYIMQESVFWRSSLWRKVKGLNRELKLSGDHDLWCRFAQHTDLVVADSIFGYFRFRPGQLSENKAAYRAEIDAHLGPAQKQMRRLQSVLYQFGFIKYRTASRGYEEDWRCKTIQSFKIGPLIIRLGEKTSQPFQNGKP